MAIATITRKIRRSELRESPDIIFIFGDNLIRKGYGGTAKECRGEPNALGIPTKKYPSMHTSAFLLDSDYDAVAPIMMESFIPAAEHIKNGGTVYVIANIGEGLSRLNKTSPRLFRLLCRCIQRLYDIDDEINGKKDKDDQL